MSWAGKDLATPRCPAGCGLQPVQQLVTLEPRWSEKGREETQRETMKNVEHENVSLGLWQCSLVSKRNTSLNLT